MLPIAVFLLHSQAKHLIEETIRRNASPVRGDERGSIFTTLGGSSSSISSHTSDETLQGMASTFHSLSISLFLFFI